MTIVIALIIALLLFVCGVYIKMYTQTIHTLIYLCHHIHQHISHRSSAQHSTAYTHSFVHRRHRIQNSLPAGAHSNIVRSLLCHIYIIVHRTVRHASANSALARAQMASSRQIAATKFIYKKTKKSKFKCIFYNSLK